MARAEAKFVIKAVDQTAKAFKSVDRNIGALAKRFAQLGGAAIAAAGAALIKFTTDAAKSIDEIAKFSKQLNISTTALSEYKFVAQQSGVEFNQFAIAMQRLSRRIGEAAQGSGEARQTLKDLNLSAKELIKLPLDVQFEKVVEALLKTKNTNVQLAQTFKLVDSEGVKLLRLFRGGVDEIRGLRSEARRLGVSFDEDIAQKAEDVIDAFGRLSSATEGIGAAFLGITAPTVVSNLGLIESFLVGIKDAIVAIDDRGIPALFDAFGGADPASAVGKVNKMISDQKLRRDELLKNIEFYSRTAGPAEVARLRETRQELQLVESDIARLIDVRDKLANQEIVASVTEIDTTAFSSRRDLADLVGPVEVPFGVERRDEDPRVARNIAELQRVLEDIKTPFERYQEQLAHLDILTIEAGLSQEAYNRAVIKAGKDYAAAQIAAEGLTDTIDRQKETYDQIADTAGSVAGDLVNAFVSANQSIGDSFKQLATRVLASLFEILVVQQIVDAAASGVRSFFGRQHGGPVFQNQPVVVGERGPELFIPNTSGSVQASAGGGPVNINFTINSIDPTEAAAVIAANKQVIIGIIKQGFNRNGRSAGLA